MYHPHPHIYTYGARWIGMDRHCIISRRRTARWRSILYGIYDLTRPGQVCARRCSDVSEVQRRGMECFSTGHMHMAVISSRAWSCSVTVPP
jgi:hypothetical protein